MGLALLGLLGALIGAAAVLVTIRYLRWAKVQLAPHLRRWVNRLYLFVAILVSLAPAELAGVDPLSAADNVPGVTYVLGLLVGIAGTLLIRRTARKK